MSQPTPLQRMETAVSNIKAQLSQCNPTNWERTHWALMLSVAEASRDHMAEREKTMPIYGATEDSGPDVLGMLEPGEG